MKTTIPVIVSLLLASPALVDSLLDLPDWNGFSVTWGMDPTSSYNTQPRTVEEAKSQGFEPIGSEGCGDPKPYNGVAYSKDGDNSHVLLYDVNGYIAGIQTRVSSDVTQQTGYPGESIRPPFVSYGDGFLLTAYFVDPSTICTEGRSQAQFESEGTGTDLYIQNGATPADVTRIPKQESDVQAPWVEGMCFPSMGKHYWNGISVDMSCSGLYPVFLLYNGGVLNSFGWALSSNLPGRNFEHPGHEVFPMFMQKVPQCLIADDTKASTMHIFLTSNAMQGNQC